MANPEAERELRAKYFDWCTARLADRFLRLTPDEIYELAQRASADSEGVAGGREGGAPGIGTELSYKVLVVLVTETLREQASLPSFEEWAAAYAEEPEPIDDVLLGFWREST